MSRDSVPNRCDGTYHPPGTERLRIGYLTNIQGYRFGAVEVADGVVVG